ncbi:MAG: hypothetical protein WCO45_13580 [Pseudanabaena sp. ELA607]|jgi:hypothetical protein
MAFRSALLYKNILSLIPIKSSSIVKDSLPLSLVYLCGQKQKVMLKESLFSLYRSWDKLPQLEIVSDGSLDKEEVMKMLSWWKGDKIFSTPEDCFEYHENLGRKSLVQFAKTNVMGLKMAAVLKSAEQSPTLYCDTDILWFRDLVNINFDLKIILSNKSELPFLKMSEDFQPAYDQNLTHLPRFSHLPREKHLCAGLILASGNIFNFCNLDDAIQVAIDKSNHFTEQTIFAEACLQLNGISYSRNEISCFVDDQFSLIPTFFGKSWIARHYVGPVRHLFWRDALALRLGNKKSKIRNEWNETDN